MKKLLVLALVVLFVVGCKSKSQNEAIPRAEAPSVPPIHDVDLVKPSTASAEDCKTGLTAIGKGVTHDCGTWIENPEGAMVGGHSVNKFKVGIKVGETVHEAAANYGTWDGANFHLVFKNVKKDPKHCLDRSGKKISECESTASFVDIEFTCMDQKQIYKKWKLVEGC